MDRFWDKVDKRGTDECWEWQAFRNKFGYGRFFFNGKKHQAHRIAWTLTNGAIPKMEDGQRVCVLHHCDNPSCCNPSHLFLGTQKENVKDMVMKMRGLVGEKNGRAKIDEMDVYFIRYWLKNGYSQRKIAEIFKIKKSQVCRINTGETWRHLEDGLLLRASFPSAYECTPEEPSFSHEE